MNDAYEQEADQIANQVMQMPAIEQTQPLPIQRKCAACASAQPAQAKEEDEQMLLQTKEAPGQIPQLSSVVEAQITSLQGGGQTLDPATRGFMESRFGHDFSRVRVHTDPSAAQTAREVGAYAYTVGSHIVFGTGQYAPETPRGRHLLAHELTHTLQQSPRSLIRRACPPPRPAFDLAGSAMGLEIQRALQTVTVPAPQAGQPAVPRVDPSQVLTILADSNCFQRDAQRAQELNPSLRIDAHELEEIGTHFIRSESRIELQVTQLAEVVKHIVHEVVHASHGGLTAAAPTASVGSVTQLERAFIAEEMQTRRRENEIMEEIYSAGSLPRAARTPATAGEVRRDFVSGLPHITYQEMAIVEEMKSRYRNPQLGTALGGEGGFVEMARTIARDFMPSVSVANLARFTIDDDFVQRNRTAVQSLLIPALSVDDALTCVRIFRAYGRRINDDMRRRLSEISPSCQLFIDRWHDYIWQNEPYDERARREFFIDILRQEEQRIHRPPAPEQSRYPDAWYGCRGTDVRQCFINLYNNILRRNRDTRYYFEWVLIAESMSYDWIRAGDGDAARSREIHLRHVEFLRRRVGDGLAGISI